MEEKKPATNLELVDECDSFPYPSTPAHRTLLSNLYTLIWKDGPTSTPIGYLLPSVLSALLSVPETIRGPLTHDESARTISLFQQPTEAERSTTVARVLQHWKAQKRFRVLSGWRNELYPVYGPQSQLLYNIERSAATLFGIVTYGVHMTAYAPSPSTPEGIKIWVPRRSYTKQTYGGMLDNTVAGGMATGEIPLDCVIREAAEEASLHPTYVRANIQPVGQMTYIYIRESRAGGEVGTIQPEFQYVYDLELEEGMEPKPGDGEVEEFYLWSVAEVKGALERREFKPNCAACMLDFLGRRGWLESGEWGEIFKRLHRELEFPGPHREEV